MIPWIMIIIQCRPLLLDPGPVPGHYHICTHSKFSKTELSLLLLYRYPYLLTMFLSFCGNIVSFSIHYSAGL